MRAKSSKLVLVPPRRNNPDDMAEIIRNLRDDVARLKEISARRTVPDTYEFTVQSGLLYVLNKDTGALSAPLL